MLSSACCFSGHRNIKPSDIPCAEALLRGHISRLFSLGVTDFFAGGALGFDTLAQRAVLEAREANGGIKLHLVLPCPQQADGWNEPSRLEYTRMLSLADSVSYAGMSYDGECMQRRNRMLVYRAGRCLCWLESPRGGTAYTVGFAKRQGREVINLAELRP